MLHKSRRNFGEQKEIKIFQFGIFQLRIYHITKVGVNMKKAIYSKEYKYLVSQVKKAREEAGLDQKKVAELLGRTQSYVSKVESGQLRLDIIQLKEFARIYKKRLDFFIG